MNQNTAKFLFLKYYDVIHFNKETGHWTDDDVDYDAPDDLNDYREVESGRRFGPDFHTDWLVVEHVSTNKFYKISSGFDSWDGYFELLDPLDDISILEVKQVEKTVKVWQEV